jgi:hypothetical protein
MTGAFRWFKAVACAALAALLLAGVFPAGAPKAEAATPFPDVRNGHWAEKHINRLYLQGLILGYSDGTYQPAKPVSREEAVLIALRFLGKAEDVPDTEVFFPSYFQVGGYFKNYVNEAFMTGLLSSVEEFKLAENEPGKQWGSSPATREWLARLLIRVIGLDAEAKAAPGTTNFADRADIDPQYAGYVQVAVEKGLIRGVTSTEFRPKANVDRATIATLFSRAQAVYPVAFSGQTAGIITEIAPDRLTVMHADGTTTEYELDPDTLYYLASTETAASRADLVQYGSVTVISRDGKRADFVELTDAQPKLATREGTFREMDAAARTITLLVDGEAQSFGYDPQRPPKITDVEDQTLELKDLKRDMPVRVSVETLRTPGTIISIHVLQSTVNKTDKGTIVSVNRTEKSVTVQLANGKQETRLLMDNATLRMNRLLLEFEELQQGDEITYKVTDGLIEEINVDRRIVSSVVGTFTGVVEADGIILFVENGENKFLNYVDDVKVVVQGLDKAGVTDLVKGDEITMTLDDKGRVTAIQVHTRSVETLRGAVVWTYDAERKYLTVDVNGSLRSYTLAPNVRFDADGTVINATDGQRRLSKGAAVNIGHTGENTAYFISFVTKYTGVITELDTTAQTIRLRLDDGSSVKLDYSAPTVDIFGRVGENIDDVKAGDRVTIHLASGSSTTAGHIQVQRTVQYEITAIDTVANRLTGRRSDGSTFMWTVGTSAPLYDARGASIQASALTVGTMVNVTFMGDTVIRADVAPVTFGRVVSVDTAAGVIELAAYNGTVQRYTVTTPVVYKGTAMYASLSMVQPNDRVEIRTDEQGRTIVTLAEVQQKKFLLYDASAKKLYWQKSSASENNAVPLHPDVYVHDGQNALQWSQFKRDDRITVYMLRGMAVEVLKQ